MVPGVWGRGDGPSGLDLVGGHRCNQSRIS